MLLTEGLEIFDGHKPVFLRLISLELFFDEHCWMKICCVGANVKSGDADGRSGSDILGQWYL